MTQFINPTPLQIQDEHIQELKLIAEEIGATRIEVLASRIKVMIYFVDPEKGDPENDLFLDELEIELDDDKDYRIFIATFEKERP